jgi:hypothetical protein
MTCLENVFLCSVYFIVYKLYKIEQRVFEFNTHNGYFLNADLKVVRANYDLSSQRSLAYMVKQIVYNSISIECLSLKLHISSDIV